MSCFLLFNTVLVGSNAMLGMSWSSNAVWSMLCGVCCVEYAVWCMPCGVCQVGVCCAVFAMLVMPSINQTISWHMD